ncbi:MAG TPA: hypothetical protein VHK69_10925, partial [Chitinophagaceae bacterium]|nr:hypothetical protein [Chitinophagaceae bacterium]
AADTIAFTDFNVRGWFGRDASGRVASLQTAWQDRPMPRMGPEEFTPGELLRAGRWAEAREGNAAGGVNESIGEWVNL